MVTLYLTRNGKEIIFAIYIPVDCVLFLGMAIYYFLWWRFSKRNEEHNKEINELVMDKTKKGIRNLFHDIRDMKNKERHIIASNSIDMAERSCGELRVVGPQGKFI